MNGKDVSIGLVTQEKSSILNEFAVTALEVADVSESDCLVRHGDPDSKSPTLLARITRKSREHLALETGEAVYARVKSVAILD